MAVAALANAAILSLAAGAAYADTLPSNSVLPTISGLAVQGDELTAGPGTWSGDSPISYAY